QFEWKELTTVALNMPISRRTPSVCLREMTIAGITRPSLSWRALMEIKWNGWADAMFERECMGCRSTAHIRDVDGFSCYNWSSLAHFQRSQNEPRFKADQIVLLDGSRNPRLL